MPVLQFKGKTAVENYHHTVPHHRLEFDAKLSLLPKGEKPSLDGNLIIEGDNLLALKALLPTHAGKVKCIYIDPPYNTGNEGWVYNDNLTQPQFKEWIGRTVGKESEDACRHDKWCCMMYPRLTLLRELISDDGIILVSIDDNELQNLISIMDELFGSEHRLACLIWKSRNFPDSRPKTGISVDHEYVVTYRKTEQGRFEGKRRSEAKYHNPDDDARGPWTSCSLLGKATREQRPNLHYDIENPHTGEVYHPRAETGWICARQTMIRKIAENRILWPKKPGGRIREKVFLAELQSGTLGFPSIIDGIFTSDGTEELRQIFGEQTLVFPKPSILIGDLIEQVTGDGDLILDSFAGTGSTAHATLRLNNTSSASRRFVLIQQPFDTKDDEKAQRNIVRTITAERVRRVAVGYKELGSESDGTKVPGLGGSFSFVRVGEPLFGEYRDFGKKLPDWETLARYIFYTETGRECDSRKFDPKSGFIGSVDAAGGTSYYLRYSPDNEENERVSLRTLPDIIKQDKNKNIVIYAERVWLHGDELAKFEAEHGRKIRPMVIPFGLK
jgi:DNA modification methylase